MAQQLSFDDAEYAGKRKQSKVSVKTAASVFPCRYLS